MRHILIISCLLLNYCVFAQVSMHPIDKEIDSCLSKNTSILDMINCHSEGLKLWENEMDKVYERIMAKISTEDMKTILKEQQDAWKKMATFEYKFNEKVYANSLGTNGLLLASSARTDAVRIRTQKLTEYLDLLEKKPIK